VTKPGLVSEASVSSVDILPTILDAAGVLIPSHVQGRSLRDVGAGNNTGWRTTLAGEFHQHGERPFFPRRALRDSRYKIIHNLLAGKLKINVGIDGDTAGEVVQTPAYQDAPIRITTTPTEPRSPVRCEQGDHALLPHRSWGGFRHVSQNRITSPLCRTCRSISGRWVLQRLLDHVGRGCEERGYSTNRAGCSDASVCDPVAFLARERYQGQGEPGALDKWSHRDPPELGRLGGTTVPPLKEEESRFSRRDSKLGRIKERRDHEPHNNQEIKLGACCDNHLGRDCGRDRQTTACSAGPDAGRQAGQQT
jgi:hypothetical protein